MKKVEDPRKKLRELARGVIKWGHPGGDAATLARAVLEFLKNETVTLVITQDQYDTMATAHPSPLYARLEMISCMLDNFENYFDREEDGTHFLELVRSGKFKAAINFWNEESRELGVDGDYYDTHNGKVEKNYTVRDLKARAADMEKCT